MYTSYVTLWLQVTVPCVVGNVADPDEAYRHQILMLSAWWRASVFTTRGNDSRHCSSAPLCPSHQHMATNRYACKGTNELTRSVPICLDHWVGGSKDEVRWGGKDQGTSHLTSGLAFKSGCNIDAPTRSPEAGSDRNAPLACCISKYAIYSSESLLTMHQKWMTGEASIYEIIMQRRRTVAASAERIRRGRGQPQNCLACVLIRQLAVTVPVTRSACLDPFVASDRYVRVDLKPCAPHPACTTLPFRGSHQYVHVAEPQCDRDCAHVVLIRRLLCSRAEPRRTTYKAQRAGQAETWTYAYRRHRVQRARRCLIRGIQTVRSPEPACCVHQGPGNRSGTSSRPLRSSDRGIPSAS